VIATTAGAGAVELAGEPTGGRQKRRLGDEAVVISATGVVSVLNYSYTVILLFMLPAREFAEVGSISALLLVCGTIAGAALPWVLAQEVLRSKHDAPRRRIAVTFCLFATVLQGVVAGLATCVIAYHFSDNGLLAAAFGSVVLIFVAATTAGFLQGYQRFRYLAALRISEVIVKIGAGVGLVALGAGAGGAIAGFALGASVVAAGGLIYMAPHVQWSWSAFAGRSLWASTQGLLAIQAGVAILASMDVVIGSLILGAQPALATYQAANILGRVPLFLGGALSIVVFPRMVAGQTRPAEAIRESFSLYVRICVPIALVTATIPSSVVTHLFPARYGDVGAILPWSAFAGLMMGVINLATTYFQATAIYRSTTKVLFSGVALCAILDVFGLQVHGILGLAVVVALGGTLVAAALMLKTVRTWPGSLKGQVRSSAGVAIACAPLFLLRGHLFLWALWAFGCGVLICLRSLRGVHHAWGSGPLATRPRILHLGYEDPKRPGAGGGSVRTHEINRRLATAYDITVVCARYKGSRERTEDGVRYVHVGMLGGDFLERLAYFAFLPYALLRYRSDLVVEDFGAPFSSVAVPWMTSRPVMGVVQWLFATEKSHQYHLPFHWVEQIGVRSHRSMIAVSEDLGGTLAERNPLAAVTVIPNGLGAAAFEHYRRARSGIAYLGRLESAQKGLDLLLEAFALVSDSVIQDLVIGGDGPDRHALEVQAEQLDIADRVHFIGRVPAGERFEWLAGVDLMVMPSRYETFGMVAAEALAVETPVVAFDIPCLRALVDEEVGSRVPAFDVPAFAEAILALATDGDLRRRRGAAGPARVAGLRWDVLADVQGKAYGQLLESAGRNGVGLEPEPPRNGAGDQASSNAGKWEGWGKSVVTVLAAQREETPRNPAVIDGSIEWNFDELHRAAAAVTEELVRNGICTGNAVGVCLPRSRHAIAAMIGVWGAAATYVPLDPDYPAARLSAMAEQASVSVVIADPSLSSCFDSTMPVLHPDVIVPGGQPPPPMSMLAEPDPESIAYILFTSGSSGRPKAVEVSHRALASLLEWIRSTITREELAVTTTSISFSFDPFILEVLGPLMVGGTVRVIASALAIGDVETGVTMLANTPSVLQELLRAGRMPSTLRTIIVGGETMSASLATDLLTSTSISRLINTYGPTEATVLVTAHEVTLPVGEAVPIGRDLPGGRIVIVDENLREVGYGQRGEICIFGSQVANGYRGDPVATDERFVTMELATGHSVRIYRTGDLGRRNGRGVIEFCGRKDRQLKLRGYRIEPAEVEAEISQHPEIFQAYVTVTGEGSGARLVAYVATTADEFSSPDLRSWLRHSLPSHMIPTHVVVMESFPTTPNGKVAVDRLPNWRLAQSNRHHDHDAVAAYLEPVHQRVATVARLAGRLLSLEGPIHPEDDVLDDLGASSLSLFQLLTAIEEEFSCHLEIGRILEDTTIAGLAGLVGAQTGGTGFLSVNAEGTRQPIFMIHAFLGTALRYRRFGSFLSPDRPLIGIQVQEFGGPSHTTRNSVDMMAEEAVAQIRAIQPEGPYLLGGHSAGGLIAYEVARRLTDTGQMVPVVVLIDSPAPRSRLHYLWAELVLNWPDVRSGDRFRRHRLARGAGSGKSRLPHDDRVGSTITRSYQASKQAVKHYHPGPYHGELVVMRTNQGVTMALGRDDLGWGGVSSGRVSTIEIPGLHNTIFEPPQVEDVGRRLNELLENIDHGSPDDAGTSATNTATAGRERPALSGPSVMRVDRQS
jgi:amino acid adenylation domain-containing protein